MENNNFNNATKSDKINGWKKKMLEKENDKSLYI